MRLVTHRRHSWVRRVTTDVKVSHSGKPVSPHLETAPILTVYYDIHQITVRWNGRDVSPKYKISEIRTKFWSGNL